MSIQQAAEAVVKVFPNVTVATPGGPLPLRVLMVALAGPQSQYDPTVRGDYYGTCRSCYPPYICDGYTSFGLWQVHLPAWYPYLAAVTRSAKPCDWAQWLYNPLNSARAAYHIYRSAQGLNAWNPTPGKPNGWYTQGASPKAVSYWIPAARHAIAQAERSSQSPSPGPSTRPSVWLWIGAGLVVLGGTAAVLDMTGAWDRLGL